MSAVETVKIKADNEKGYRVINRSSFDSKQHKLAEGEADPATLSDDEQKLADEDAARRKVEANRGQTGGAPAIDSNRNPSGTFSEPTPSDVRYPNKDATEFENNHGAFVGKSAAEMRAAAGMEDKPGGLIPEIKEAEDAKEADARLQNKRQRDGEVDEPRRGRKPAEPTENLDEMTVAQLREYAASHEIDLGDATRKDDIRAAIDLAEGGSE